MRKLLYAVLLLATVAGCKKEEDKNPNQSANGTDFTSVRQYDINGVRTGNINDATDDYTHEDWPDWVFDLFTPLDTVNLEGYTKSSVSVKALYPNPCSFTQTLNYFATQQVNLKLAIIDQNKKVYFLKSFHLFNGEPNLSLDYEGLGLLPGNYYRMFYGFSAEDAPFYHRGHIDILVDLDL